MQKSAELQIWAPCFKRQELPGQLLQQAENKLRIKYVLKLLVDYINYIDQWQQQRFHYGQWGDDWFVKICRTLEERDT